MNNSKLNIGRLSSHIFWDVDIESLDEEKDFPFIVKRILELGLLSDWLLLTNHFNMEEITTVAKQFKDLDSRSLSFISTLSKEPKSSFRCYTTQQSIPPHWKF